MSKKEVPNELRKRLDEFHVEIPEIPTKSSKLERIANWIHAPAKNPIDILSISGNSITKLVFYPFILFLVLLIPPIFLF